MWSNNELPITNYLVPDIALRQSVGQVLQFQYFCLIQYNIKSLITFSIVNVTVTTVQFEALRKTLATI